MNQQEMAAEQAHAFQGAVQGWAHATGRHLAAITGTDYVAIEECHAGEGYNLHRRSSSLGRAGWTAAHAGAAVGTLMAGEWEIVGPRQGSGGLAPAPGNNYPDDPWGDARGETGTPK